MSLVGPSAGAEPFLAEEPFEYSVVSVLHAGLLRPRVRKPNSYAAVEHPLRLALPGIRPPTRQLVIVVTIS